MNSLSASDLLALVVIILLVFGGCAFFFGGNLLVDNMMTNSVQQDNWSPREYVPNSSDDCFVPPQGDPLYDEHYAEINGKNCAALVDQSTSKQIDEDTRATKVDTNTGIVGIWIIGLVVVGFLAFMVYAGTRG